MASKHTASLSDVSPSRTLALSLTELRAVTRYAAECASFALTIFEHEYLNDSRPREAINAAITFAAGANRTASLRASSWAAYRAAQRATSPAARQAAFAASHAAAAAYLHPLANANQVKHILGAAAHAAHAAELASVGDPRGLIATVEFAVDAPLGVRAVLRRYPAAPAGGGRIGELIRFIDSSLRKS